MLFNFFLYFCKKNDFQKKKEKERSMLELLVIEKFTQEENNIQQNAGGFYLLNLMKKDETCIKIWEDYKTNGL